MKSKIMEVWVQQTQVVAFSLMSSLGQCAIVKIIMGCMCMSITLYKINRLQSSFKKVTFFTFTSIYQTLNHPSNFMGTAHLLYTLNVYIF